MRTFLADSNNDLCVGTNGLLAVGVDADAVRQCCKTAVQARLGEMLYQADEGMPMFQTAFDTYLPVQFEAAARSVIMKVDGVERIPSFSVQRVDDVLIYSATIETIYGQVLING